jgi:preprotein translocase subunit SecD
LRLKRLRFCNGRRDVLRERSIAGAAMLLVIAFGLACSVLSPRKPLTWHVTLELDSPIADRDAAVKRTIDVLKKRLDAVGVINFEVQQVDPVSGRIDLKLPEVTDRERLKHFLTAGGRLELTPVMSSLSPSPVQTYQTKEGAANVAASQNGQVAPYEPGQATGQPFVILEKTSIVTGQDLRSATAIPATGRPDEYSIAFTLRRDGAMRLGDWTRSHINSYLAIVLNGSVVSVAYIKGEILDSGEISGRFSKSSAEDLAHILNSGALPAPIRIVEEGAIK